MKLTTDQKKGSITLNTRCRWESRYPVWGQLNYTTREEVFGRPCVTSTFASVVWRDGYGVRAYVMTPYLCYSGDPAEIEYHPLSWADTARIGWIAAKTLVKHIRYHFIPAALRVGRHRIISIITAPIRALEARRARKRMDKFFQQP